MAHYKNIKYPALLLFSLCMSFNAFGSADASSSSAQESLVDAQYKAYTFMHTRKEYGEKLRQKVLDATADPMNACLDFSLVGLRDEDLKSVFEGLVNRELSVAKDRTSLYLLNIESDNITEDGLKGFLQNLQKGVVVTDSSSKSSKRIIPDVRQTIVRIGFELTKEFMEKLQGVAPSVFAGSLRIVY